MPLNLKGLQHKYNVYNKEGKQVLANANDDDLRGFYEDISGQFVESISDVVFSLENRFYEVEKIITL